MPMETSRKVPRNSASRAFHMLRLSVMSATPMNFFSPGRRGRVDLLADYEAVKCWGWSNIWECLAD